MYTSHGYQIPGTPVEGVRGPVARCGGITLCSDCKEERLQSLKDAVPPTGDAALYRVRVSPVEARQVSKETVESIALWCGGRIVKETNPITHEESSGINVPGGNMPCRASEGDWVVQTPSGQFQVYGPERFKAMFEAHR